MFDVHIGYRYIRYTEEPGDDGQERVLVIDWDWGGTADSFWIELPSETFWKRGPKWLRGRQEEILGRIREATAHMGFRNF